MDLYLIANCKFFVVSASGIMLLATLYGKATVVHNLPFISFAGDMAMPLSPERDIILMKKANINVNRKMLAEMAVNDPKAFSEIVAAIK